MSFMRLKVQFPEARERRGANFRSLRAPVSYADVIGVDMSRGTRLALPDRVDAKPAAKASDKEVGWRL